MGILTQEQANFILSSRLKGIKPKAVRDMSKDDGYEAFKELRWGWTGGRALCPHCLHERLYEFADRDKFKCAKCGRQFSTTTATAFKGRKTDHKTIIGAMSVKIHQPMTLMELGGFLAVNYRTAWRLNKLLGLIRGNVRIRASERVWPYVPHRPDDNGADLVQMVNYKIPKGIPEHIRADICQEIILGVLEGNIRLDDVAKQAQQYVRKFWGKADWERGHISIDAARMDGRSWHDVLESRHSRLDGDIDAEMIGYEPLDMDEYGYNDREEEADFMNARMPSRQPRIGDDRYEFLKRSPSLGSAPVLNIGHRGGKGGRY